jgi:uncharacterized membrane protein YqjE
VDALQDQVEQMQSELTFTALSLLLITLLAVTLVVFALVSMWKENRFSWPLKGTILRPLAIDLKRGATLVIT